MKRVLAIFLTAILFTLYVAAETKTAVRPSELLPAITADIAEKYPGYTITEAFKVKNKDVISYEVLIQKGSDKQLLRYNAKGIFLKKEIPSAKPKVSPKPGGKASANAMLNIKSHHK
ncbi:MAG: hypothetical protein Q8928_01335 [Bacteroidota bacterium]|nr:hypothetical protein [Bacteroidota bacterium]